MIDILRSQILLFYMSFILCYSIYQLSQIDVTPMSLRELSSVEYVREERQDGWFLYKTHIVTTPKKAQAIYTISVTLSAD